MSVFPDDIFAADPLAAVIEEKTLQLKEGERRNVSILFADLKGFTEMSEKLDPELVNGYMSAGTYPVTWDANDLSSGIYFVKMEADECVGTQKLMLIK